MAHTKTRIGWRDARHTAARHHDPLSRIIVAESPYSMDPDDERSVLTTARDLMDEESLCADCGEAWCKCEVAA